VETKRVPRRVSVLVMLPDGVVDAYMHRESNCRVRLVFGCLSAREHRTVLGHASRIGWTTPQIAWPGLKLTSSITLLLQRRQCRLLPNCSVCWR
jgi:hypothetical protein